MISSIQSSYLPKTRKQSVSHRPISFPSFKAPAPELSAIRRVFQTSSQMKQEFAKFLQTIFYKLDDKKVFQKMEEILKDPNKSDEQIYNDLVHQIDEMKVRFAPLWELWSLRILKKGMGDQAAELLKNFDKSKFHDYLEIYDRRYLNDIRSSTKMPLDGETIAICDSFEISLVDRIQAGALFSLYPYKTHLPLNDPDCENPLETPQKTHRPLDDSSIGEGSVDLIACLGGLHHIPKERVHQFTASLSSKLRPGGVFLLRDHNITDGSNATNLSKSDLKAIAATVHTFVNAGNKLPWSIENKEIREFKSMAEWSELLQKHGLTPISPESLVLKNDPTENAMMAFIKAPRDLKELRNAINYRSDCERTRDGSRSTWLEWGNVRFSKQYSEFLQSRHWYAFDYIGHMRQHWQHFINYIAESKKAGVPLQDLVFSDNFFINLFILNAAAIQCAVGACASLPSQIIARATFGPDWRNNTNLTDLENFEAQTALEYSNFIDHSFFHTFDYMGKIPKLWKVIQNSQEHWTTKFTNTINGAFLTLSYFSKGVFCLPIRAIYTSESFSAPETVKLLIKDTTGELEKVSARWEKEKDTEKDRQLTIDPLYSTPDGYKLISVPRYRPFTQICKYFSETKKLELLEVGCQKSISIDIRLSNNEIAPAAKGARFIYEVDRLQDAQKRRYATYQVEVPSLTTFIKTVGAENIEYIHE